MLAPMLLASGLIWGGDWLETHILEEPGIVLLALAMKILGGVTAVKALNRMVTKLQDILSYLRSRRRGKLKGAAGWLSERQARRLRLDRRKPGTRLIGVLGRSAIFAGSETHQLILGPSGTSKSTAGFFPLLCGLGDSAVVNDSKKELYAVTAAYRRRYLRHRIVLLDPDDPDADCVNPLDDLADLIAANSPIALTYARALSFQMKPDPPKPDQNAFFTIGSRELITGLNCAVAATCPPEHRTLATTNRALSDPSFLHELLDRAMAVEALDGAIAELASSLHAQAFGDDGAAKTHEQFRLGAAQATAIYAKGGPLARITSRTTFRFADMKHARITAYLVVDYANKDAAGPWAGMMQWLATWQLVQERTNTPVYLLLDEFCNAPLNGLPTMLTLLRSYGIRCIMATQDLDDIHRVYGKNALESVLSEADIKQFLGGIRSQTTLDYLSKYLGNETEHAPSYSFQKDGVQESLAKTERPLKTPDELRRLSSEKQIVIWGNLKPMLLRKVQVFAIHPWRHRIGINTMYSKRRHLLPIEIRLRWWGTQVTPRGWMARTGRVSSWPIWVFLARKLSPGAWVIFLLVALALTAEHGMPHLRASYGYVGPYSARRFTWCRYIGPRPFTINGPSCPFIILRKSN